MAAMSFAGDRRLVVFGFGPIGAGLFVYEAFRTGDFASPMVVDVQTHLVDALRGNGGQFGLNVAQANGVDVHMIGPVEPVNPLDSGDRERVVAAIAGAEVAVTCLPGTAFYDRGDASPAALIAEGTSRRTRREPMVLYAAENAVNAAATLTAAIRAASPVDPTPRIDARDTVIGKMSGIQSDPVAIEELGLARVTPGYPAAMLVEAFDAIRVSGTDAPGYPTFLAAPDLEPFEYAKLYGHNATHALGAFLGAHLGLEMFADLVGVDGAMDLLRDAFELESGAALVQRFHGVDALFTEDGYRAYVLDLLARMTNPYLRDSIERAGRDPRRKLGWDDRLIGTMRVCLAEGVTPLRYALGAAAGLAVIEPGVVTGTVSAEKSLRACWAPTIPPGVVTPVMDLVLDGLERLRTMLAGLEHPGEGIDASFGR
jgi:mannitol-1-phosphate 5-dehydrogenase